MLSLQSELCHTPIVCHNAHVPFPGGRPGGSPGHERPPTSVFSSPRITEIHNKPTRQLVSFGQVSDRIRVLFSAGTAYEQTCNIPSNDK